MIEVRCLEIEDTHLRGSGVVAFGGNEKEDWFFFFHYMFNGINWFFSNM